MNVSFREWKILETFYASGIISRVAVKENCDCFYDNQLEPALVTTTSSRPWHFCLTEKLFFLPSMHKQYAVFGEITERKKENFIQQQSHCLGAFQCIVKQQQKKSFFRGKLLGFLRFLASWFLSRCRSCCVHLVLFCVIFFYHENVLQENREVETFGVKIWKTMAKLTNITTFHTWKMWDWKKMTGMKVQFFYY